MNERDLSLIKALSEEFGLAMKSQQDHFSRVMDEQRGEFEKKVELLSRTIEELKNVTQPDYRTMINDALAELPPIEPLPLPDIASMVQAAVDEIPTPNDGKSVTPEDVTPLLQKMVDEAFRSLPTPKNGKDFDPEVLNQAVAAAVSDAVAALPSAQPGEPGRDALALEILPQIDAQKSYSRGAYATHNGGLWRSYEKTHGMRGWECVVDGVSGIDISQDQERKFTITLERTSGLLESKSFDVPVSIYRDVFKAGSEYEPGDTVTWGGSLWHCNEKTSDKPGEPGSKGWTLAVKKGRDLRDKP